MQYSVENLLYKVDQSLRWHFAIESTIAKLLRDPNSFHLRLFYICRIDFRFQIRDNFRKFPCKFQYVALIASLMNIDASNLDQELDHF